MSSSQLWSKLASAGLTVGDMPATAEAHAPWYVRVMLGIGGLIAAGFLVGFVAAGFAFIVQSNVASLAVGLMIIAGAYAVFRAAPPSDFLSMFALAASFAGQALMIFGVLGFFDRHVNGAMPWAVIAVIEAVLAVAMPNFIHRTLSALAAGLAFAYACEVSGARAVPAGVVAAAVAFVWLNEARLGKLHAIVAPVGYGLTLAFMQIEGMALLRNSVAMVFGSRISPEASSWIGEALVVATLLVSVGVLLKRTGWTLREPRTVLALVAAAAIGAASFKAPGIAGGLMIVLLGFANGNRVLVGLGIAFRLV
jgi:hypothetical protein